MVRIGLAVVALALVALLLMGIAMGLGLVQVDSHGLSLAHKDTAADGSSDQSRVVSADDLLRQKGVSYSQPAPAVDTPKRETAPVVPAPVVAAPSAPKVTAPAPAPAADRSANSTAADARTAAADRAGARDATVDPQQNRRIIRVAAGSKTPLTDPAGNVWDAASGFDGGEIKPAERSPIHDTRFPALFGGEWWNAKAWRHAVPNGDYTVLLHFAETSNAITGPRVRVFHVQVKDQDLGEVDVWKESGGPCRELVRTAIVTVRDGTLSVEFTKIGEHFPMVCGIEVIPGRSGGERVAAMRDEARRATGAGAIRVNAGSLAPARDPRGNVWEAESGFEGGQIVDRGPIAIANTDFPDIYRTEHYMMTAWNKLVPNGKYTVNLHFAETSEHVTESHPRIFHVNVQGNELRDFNVARVAGGNNKALVKTYHVNVTDGHLSVQFQRITDDGPEINGIEVIPDPLAIRVDAGSASAVRDPRGNIWEADSGFEGGQTVDRGAIAIANTDFPDIYRTERYDMKAWRRRVDNGRYTVNLHFAETWDGITDTHQRIFHVKVQGTELRDLNVAKETGGLRRALVKTFHVAVTDNTLTVLFEKFGENVPEINGIEILRDDSR